MGWCCCSGCVGWCCYSGCRVCAATRAGCLLAPPSPRAPAPTPFGVLPSASPPRTKWPTSCAGSDSGHTFAVREHPTHNPAGGCGGCGGCGRALELFRVAGLFSTRSETGGFSLSRVFCVVCAPASESNRKMRISLHRYGGLARYSQLRRDWSRTDIDSSSLVRVARGWRSDAPDHAGLRAVRLGGRLTCMRAAETYGLWVPPGDTNLHVHVDTSRSPYRAEANATIHCHADLYHPQPNMPLWRDTLKGTLASIVRCAPFRDAVATVDSALHQGLIERSEFVAVADSLPRRFRSIVRHLDPQAESGIESHLRLIATGLGLTPRPQVTIPGLGRVDFLVHGSVILEADGQGFHSDPTAFERDRHRDAVAAALGFTRLRFSARQILCDEPLVRRALISVFAL